LASPLAEIHARSDEAADVALREVLSAYEIQDVPPAKRPVLLEVVS